MVDNFDDSCRLGEATSIGARCVTADREVKTRLERFMTIAKHLTAVKMAILFLKELYAITSYRDTDIVGFSRGNVSTNGALMPRIPPLLASVNGPQLLDDPWQAAAAARKICMLSPNSTPCERVLSLVKAQFGTAGFTRGRHPGDAHALLQQVRVGLTSGKEVPGMPRIELPSARLRGPARAKGDRG